MKDLKKAKEEIKKIKNEKTKQHYLNKFMVSFKSLLSLRGILQLLAILIEIKLDFLNILAKYFS